MTDNTSIQWTDENWNPIVEPDAMLYWRVPRRVRVADLFRTDVTFDTVDQAFAVMALCPMHRFYLPTKRPERMAEYCDYAVKFDNLEEEIARRVGWEGKWPHPTEGDWPLRNLWLGTSCENQAAADARIPHLLRCPAAIRFLSCEPLLGPVDLSLWLTVGPREIELRDISDGGCVIRRNPHGGFGWVIVGGESGPKARPCDVAWIRSIRDQCAAANVPCFIKQLGSRPVAETGLGGWPDRNNSPLVGTFYGSTGLYHYKPHDPHGGDPAEWPADLRVRQWPKEAKR